KRDQLRRVFARVVLAAPGPAVVDLNVVADAPTRLLQPLQKCRVAGLRLRIVRGVRHEHADAPQALALLRARRERPRHGRAAEKQYELAAPHSITSSARPSSVIGKVRPSDFAVFMLMTSSTFVDCWTGRSAGFSPWRMRPV